MRERECEEQLKKFESVMTVADTLSVKVALEEQSSCAEFNKEMGYFEYFPSGKYNIVIDLGDNDPEIVGHGITFKTPDGSSIEVGEGWFSYEDCMGRRYYNEYDTKPKRCPRCGERLGDE